MKKTITIITILASTILLSSCGCDTPECIKAEYEGKAQYEKALKERHEIEHKQNEERKKAQHARDLEILKNTPPEVLSARENAKIQADAQREASEEQARAIKQAKNTYIGVEVAKFLLK